MYKPLRIIIFLLFFGAIVRVNAQVNLSSGLVAYYPFNGTFNDASGNGNHGTGMNGISYGTDQWGNANNAASFDGVNDYIGIPSNVGISPSYDFTVAFRFKTNSSALQILFSKSDWTGASAPNNFQHQIGINGGSVLPNNGLFFATAHTGNTCVKSQFLADHYSYGSTTSTGTWYCVILTFSNGIKKVYINGVLISTSSVTSTPNNSYIDSCSSGQLRIGAWWQNDPRWFNGLIDEVRLWKRTINSQEIDSVCNLKGGTSETIINRYAAITGRLPCSNTFSVDSTDGFGLGDTVLVMQMKGADIDSSNSASFGSVQAYNSAGNYEYNIIQSVSGNNITLKYQLLKSYDIPKGRVQFIRVPYYTAYTISQEHTCLPWTGTKGGVYAINVAGTLTLNSGINVSGRGFRGGQPQFKNLYTCNKTDYYYPSVNNDAGRKGEGITELSLFRAFGRGAQGNGGGGGNDHNSGGGGGGGYASGGLGGNQYNLGNCATTPNIGGIGGVTLTGFPQKVFLGGGGGCGHGNDTAEKAGGNGGGIIFLNAAAIISNNATLKVNGDNAPECSGPGVSGGGCMNDGGGGGGGGGLVFSTATSITGNLNIEAKGGKGSNIYVMPGIPPTGPGGGGAGGAWAYAAGSSGAGVSFNGNGGASGVGPQFSNSNHGAAAGANGRSLNSVPIPWSTVTYSATPPSFSFSYSIVSCNTAKFNATSTGNIGISTYQWDFGSGNTSTTSSPTYTFPALDTFTVSLTVTDSNGCTGTISRQVIITPYTGSKKDTGICEGQSIQLGVYANAITYLWTPAIGLSSTNISNPIASPKRTTTYYVKVDAGAGCIFTDTFLVRVSPIPQADFYYKPVPPIPNMPFQFYNTSTNATTYIWAFGDGTGSSEINPSHLYKKSGIFKVCLTASSGQSCSDTLCKTIEADVRTSIAVPTAFSPNGDGANDFLLVRGGGVQSFNLKIFNRWGQMVFETSEFSKGWDGTFKGQRQEMDIFGYILTATFIDGSSSQRTGNITLLR